MSTLTTSKNFFLISFACLNRKSLSSKDCHIPLLMIDLKKSLVNCCQVSKECKSTDSLESCIVGNLIGLPNNSSNSLFFLFYKEILKITLIDLNNFFMCSKKVSIQQ